MNAESSANLAEAFANNLDLMLNADEVKVSGPVIQHLGAWAAHHSIDPDLALLLCSNIAAHVAGPLLGFRGDSLLGGHPPPTLVGAADDVGFDHAAVAARESLSEIEQKLIVKSRGLNRQQLLEAVDFRDSVERSHTREIEIEESIYYHDNTQLKLDMTPLNRYSRKEALMHPRFMLPGRIPAKPENELSGYHLGTALATGAIEKLPPSQRAREARVDVLARSVSGMSLKSDDRRAATREGTGSIRGILRFMRPDLEWMAQSRPDFMMQILPMGCLDEHMPVSFDTDIVQVQAFDRVRRKILHDALDHRRYLAVYQCKFNDPQAEKEFMKQRAIFHAEVRTGSHLSPSAVCLPDLLTWYLLRTGAFMTRQPDEMELVAHAFTAARNLRLRAVDFYNRCAVIKQARERLALAYKLVERMRTLDRPCKRRDLVRGLNIQRMDVLGPVIDSLVGIGAFTESGGVLAMCPQASGKPLNENDFMEVHAVELDFAEYPLPAPDEERASLRKNISPPKPAKPPKQLQR